VRLIQLYLPILIASLSACKNKQEQVSALRFPVYEKAESFFNVNNEDSAFYYFNLIATNPTDSLEAATALTYMGIIQTYQGDYFGGQESYLRSLSYLNERLEAHRYCLQSNYNELGNNNVSLKNYDAAIGYFDKALKFTTSNDYQIIALNGKALAYQKKGAYKQADSLYNTIIGLIKNNPKEYARILSNQAKTRWLQNSAYRAESELLKALLIRSSIKDIRGLNASYAHLSDYYANSKPDSALYYAQQMYTTALQIGNPDDELEALTKLLNLSPDKQLKKYIIRYEYLNDSLQTARNAAKNQFALIRYEAEKNKADNLQLQKDNAQKKVQLLQQQAAIAFMIVFVVVAGIITRMWLRKRKQQMEFEKRADKLKTSQKVHDVVANRLYRIMTELEHKDITDKESLLDQIEELYERSRDISYEMPKAINNDFSGTISAMRTAFAGTTTSVYVTGNSKQLWDRITSQAQLEIEQVLQELMINMKKHSCAQNVVLKFESHPNFIQIHYSDDGNGLPPSFKYNNGLTNTENRIQSIGGNIIFEKTLKGLKSALQFQQPNQHDNKSIDSRRP
jgi:signal transduction histidine kinase